MSVKEKKIENEFRTGNYFIGYDDKYSRIDIDFFYLLKHERVAVDEIIKSFIEITPEILENSGFAYRQFLNDYFIEVGLNSILIITKYETKICASNQLPCIFNSTKYLHQLQNLYFSLTGKELKIDL